jgi:hypothetical protein
VRAPTVSKRRVREDTLTHDARRWSFACSSALFVEFESRAVVLGCSVDWLLAEAMQRLLAETRGPLPPPAPPPVSAVSDVAPRAQVHATDDVDDLRATEEWAGVPPPATIVLSVGGQKVRVDREPFVIGRRADEGIDLVIDQAGVSRRHAMLERGESGWLIFDLGSKNGTLVNDNYVAGAPLRAGDLISLGPVFVAVE